MNRFLRELFCRHDWTVHQVGLRSTDNDSIVLAWRQCERCAKSKLIHILQ